MIIPLLDVKWSVEQNSYSMHSDIRMEAYSDCVDEILMIHTQPVVLVKTNSSVSSITDVRSRFVSFALVTEDEGYKGPIGRIIEYSIILQQKEYIKIEIQFIDVIDMDNLISISVDLEEQRVMSKNW
jgi:hypothetical protein